MAQNPRPNFFESAGTAALHSPSLRSGIVPFRSTRGLTIYTIYVTLPNIRILLKFQIHKVG